jgi:hypothetical protein
VRLVELAALALWSSWPRCGVCVRLVVWLAALWPWLRSPCRRKASA